MAEHAAVWAALSFLAAAVFSTLAVSIHRHAERGFEVTNVIAITLFLALRSVIFAAYVLSGSALAAADIIAHSILANGAYLVQILVCAAVVHYLLLATRRLMHDSGELAGTSAIFRIARSEPLLWSLGLTIWGSAVLAIGERAYQMFGTLNGSATRRIQPLLPSIKIPAGFVLGFLAVIGICTQAVASGHAYRRRKGAQTKSFCPFAAQHEPRYSLGTR